MKLLDICEYNGIRMKFTKNVNLLIVLVDQLFPAVKGLPD